ncbi:MAG: 3-hydroxyacyl-CoA dehydrogenase [Hyphomicrobiales bacterium]|nr:3-hydroxyacyl-CoA dehydrogenase [Hyphomicrobiales bacterium]MCP5373658.1 3-hydroxyacyl-CoA dehydrogenase [Hyphomicrobiales bacterium]
MSAIQKVAVIGAGVMGAGIAAHVANAGLPVVLLDIVPEGAANRSAIAEGALAKLLKAQPAAFMHSRNARLVTPGNIEDDLDKLADVDWIVEAVIERPDIKRDLYAKVQAVRKPGSIVSSNTSTIPLKFLVEGLPEDFAADFLITHFFNPPRYMRLLELVAGDKTRPDAVEAIRAFGDRALGKCVVDCKDTPGFIANRIGAYWTQAAVTAAIDGGLTVEEADAVMGRPVGVPKTGIFGLMDLVGIDLMPHVSASMDATLPAGDALRDLGGVPDLVMKMIGDGYSGRKGKGGFYRINRDGGGKVKESIDLRTGAYAKSGKAALDSLGAARKGGLQALMSHDDRGGQYAWKVMSGTLAYAASLVPEIADTVAAVDEAMRTGYAWKYGPFELIDRVGADWFAARLEAEGRPVPDLLQKARAEGFYRVHDGVLQFLAVDGSYQAVPRAEGVLLLSDVKRRSKRVDGNGSASLWDVGDGVACLEFHTKMNSFDPGIIAMIEKSLRIVPRQFKALVIHNEADNFSVGANVGLILFAANLAAWGQVDEMVAKGQQAFKALKYAPFPVVGAPSGMALGGGCEVLLHCGAVQAHAETYMGLVEAGVGIVPGWGGCKELLVRWAGNPKAPRGPMPPVAKAFELIGTAQVAKSAAEAQAMLFLRPTDGITMNRDRLLADAKAKALSMAEGYAPPAEPEIRLPGAAARTALAMAVRDFHSSGKATDHDVVVAGRLAEVLSGGDTDVTETLAEDDIYDLEREALVALLHTPATLARIEHMLNTGKPLRN